MLGEPNALANVTPRTATVATGADTLIDSSTDSDLAATAKVRHVVRSITCGYTAIPAATEFLTVKFGGVIKWKVPIAAIGPYHFEFPDGLYNDVNEALEVILDDPQAGAGWLNVSTQ